MARGRVQCFYFEIESLDPFLVQGDRFGVPFFTVCDVGGWLTVSFSMNSMKSNVLCHIYMKY